ncbi:spermidine/putrescine transport system permease protein PotB [Yoonia vestfoldensis]|uniref:Spermidine/putrescine transport system permease protein PotB n=2 Tax=Yoonia vestfoldensis TaxID=245188 RepID=A0A1Y0EFS0_9RHOB|nr:spermidine/putrescine transport system permease protein PotB [Yoonia vestfoldensis]
MWKPKSLAQRRKLMLFGLLTPPTVFLAVFFIVPLGIMLVYSFLEPGLYGGVVWSFSDLNYGRILGWADTKYEKFDPVYLGILFTSVRLAGLTVLLTMLICYPAAFWISRMSAGKKNLFLFLITLPFFVSLVVRLFAWVLILRPTGFLNQALIGLGIINEPLEIIYTDLAVIIGMTYVFIPFMFLPLYASVEKLDMSLIEASADLGGTKLQTFLRIILPATLPGIVGGSIIVFIPALGNFIVPSVLGGAKVLMIGNLIEQQFLSARNWPFGAALGMMVMGTVLILLIYYVRLLSREDKNAEAK